MAVCEVCGNDYHLSFEVTVGGRRHMFDSFECAISKLALTCAHCGCRIMGHGVEATGTLYCCPTVPGRKEPRASPTTSEPAIWPPLPNRSPLEGHAA